MADEKHLLLTISGGYTATPTAFQNETWQTSIRLALVFGTVDDIGTLPSNWVPESMLINRTETDWTITGNWAVGGPGGTDFRGDDYLDEQAGPAVKAWMQRTSCFSSRVQLRELRLYPIGDDGRAVPAVPYAVGTPLILTYTGTRPVGGDSGAMVPPQISTVTSHRTGQVGRRGRGRSFTPPINVSSLSEGQLSTTTRDALLASQIDLLQDLALDTVGIGSPQIKPIITGSPWVDYAVITSVQVDTILDTQRRRRNQGVGSVASDPVEYT